MYQLPKFSPNQTKISPKLYTNTIADVVWGSNIDLKPIGRGGWISKFIVNPNQ